ncbi:MmgE/PrpD family protein [Marinicauda algicola]|uniref:MmgE/PrpD family protein n=1 Tax=Marinicauda algicola TaxID=2029849 RepID=UPI0019CFD46C
MGVAHARLCFAYTGAVALRRGAVRLDDFTAQALRDPSTLGARRPDRGGERRVAGPAAFTPQTLTVRLKSGAVKRARTEALYGSPAKSMSQADARAKLEHCLDFAGAAAGADALTRAVDELDRLPDIRTLTGLLGADA